jgi:excisionase family DNA binding protein
MHPGVCTNSFALDDMTEQSTQILREPLLDAEQAATLLGVPKSSVYAYAARGELPHLRIGRHLKFIRSDLERVLAERRMGI